MKFMGVLALTCGFLAAPLMTAGNASGQPSCDGSGCVPFVAHDVASGQPCVFHDGYVFGLDKSGRTLVCDSLAQWTPSKPLIGVRTLGAPCDGSSGLAQAPDGMPMVCNGQSWVQGYGELYFAKPIFTPGT
jgi:hypothetical protein